MNNLEDLKLKKIFINSKMNYSLANKEGLYIEETSAESDRELFEFKCKGVSLQLGDIPIKAIDAIYTHARGFNEFPSVTGLKKSWRSIERDYRKSERSTIRAYLVKPDPNKLSERDRAGKEEAFEEMVKMGIYKR